MADPLLTSLCAICHIEPPKYKCPRCTIRTCSLACTKRHKAWSSCNGIRDATAYVPPSKLKTAAGVDHDYNFLSGIERAVQRSEKEIVEERHLLRPEDLRPIEVRSVQWKVGRDGRRRRVLVTEVLRGDNNAGGGGGSRAAEMLSSVPMRKRLEKFGILLRRAPLGMARQRENATTFSKASGRVNWQVEWLVLPSETTTQQEKQGDDKPPAIESKRFLAKALDDTPLYKAFAMGKKFVHDDLARKEQQRLQQQEDGDEPDETRDNNAAGMGPGGRHKKRRKHPYKPGQSLATAQDTETGAWHPGRYCMQSNNTRGAWTPHTGVPAFTGTTEEEETQKTGYSFFLAGTTSAAASAAGQTVVHAVDAALPLGEALRDMTVLEFPTIYVAESGVSLPGSLLREPKPVRLTQKRKHDSSQQLFGRKRGKGTNKKPRRTLEDGEVPSGDDDESDGAAADDGTLGTRDEIIAEESLGEEEDDDDDGSESTTSSSGSDTDVDVGVAASLAAKLALLKK